MPVAEDLIRRFPNNPSVYNCPLDEQDLCRTCGGSHSIAGESDPAQSAQFLSVLSLPPIGLRLAAAGEGQRCDRLPGAIARNQPGRRWQSSMDLPLPCRGLCPSRGDRRRQSTRSPKRTVFGPTTPFAVTGRTSCRAPFMPSRSGVLQAGLRLAGERDHADEAGGFRCAVGCHIAQGFCWSHADNRAWGENDPHH